MDQDLIPRSDFVSMHYRNARKNHFISGGAIVLPESFSHAITEEDIRSGRAFSIKWIRSQGVQVNWKYSKDRDGLGGFGRFMINKNFLII